ncbi:hypothetical protein [Novosphingobium sp. BW1]|uniref:hypothetical protein n=1 Tax=Novosphingobium sp. BW1 TaxID=2592621 RepID=UPI0011DE9D84|nr:hypothetical protein [Novosphingobium sp. BW1]TYC93555.1 hypothetical protein FMM79_01255 [Novosphingobium sp. BW1]
MRVITRATALAALAIAVTSAPALADDPRDPRMRSRAAREADAAEIRRLNREQAAYVARRDAHYAQGWDAWRAAEADRRVYEDYSARAYEEDRRAYEDDRSRYARARQDYEADRAAWERDVRACRQGYYSRCGG